MKRQSLEWEKIFANKRSGKGLIFRICKQLMGLNVKNKHESNKKINGLLFFSPTVVYDSLWPHGLQHARLPFPSPSPGACSNSCPFSQRCHPTISSSVIPFSHLPSFPASGSFQMSQLFTSGGQSIGVSASTSVLPMNIQDWSPLGWTDWISLQTKGLLRVFPNTTVQKHQLFSAQLSSGSNSHIPQDYWKKHSLD